MKKFIYFIAILILSQGCESCEQQPCENNARAFDQQTWDFDRVVRRNSLGGVPSWVCQEDHQLLTLAPNPDDTCLIQIYNYNGFGSGVLMTAVANTDPEPTSDLTNQQVLTPTGAATCGNTANLIVTRGQAGIRNGELILRIWIQDPGGSTQEIELEYNYTQ